ncbi:MAG: chemotaxis protein CheW [Candidatus Rokuibacteriota bacterium]
MSVEPVGTLDTVRACVFVLGSERFAVDVAAAREVVVLEDLTVVPRGPAHLIGVTNLRGYILPILDVRPLLGLPARPVAAGTRVLVVEVGSVQAGIAIDGIRGLATFDEVLPLDDAARRAYGDFGLGRLRYEDGKATLLAPARILAAITPAGKGE